MAVNNGEIRISVREDHTGISKQYVDSKVEQEATARQEADSALRSELTALVEQEATARQNAITAETIAREASEGTLSARITANTGAIEAVGDRVTAEAGTRASEDARIEAVVEANRQATANTFASVNQTIADNDIACQQRVATVNEKVDQKAAESAALVLAERQAREASEALIRSYVDTKTAGALHYKGTVATVANLPHTGQVTGDMYNVQADGQNYAWDGSRWDSMGALIDLDPLWSGINANASAITEEANSRQSAVATVQSNLNAEITNRQSAVATVQGNLDTEVGNRQTAISGVQSAVTAEVNRATAKEQELEQTVGTFEDSITGLTEKVFGGNNYTEGYYLNAQGTRVASANWCVSNPIPLDADAFSIGLRLIFGGYINTARFCLFDSNNQLVTAFGLTDSGSRNLTSSQLAGSTSATYCVLSFAKGTVGEVTTIGQTKTYYTSGTTPSIDEKIEGIIVDDSNLADNSVTTAKLANKSVSFDKVSFKVNSKNLLNYEDEDFTPNTYLPNLNPNEQYSTSGFIPVEPGKSYVVSRIGAAVNFRMAYGYTSKTSAGVQVAKNASTFSIAENSEIKFVRVTIFNSANKTQIEEGLIPTEYEDYGGYIDPAYIKNNDSRVDWLVTPPEIVMPSTIYALKGYQNSIYHKNYLKYWLPDVWAIQGNSSSSAWSYRERCFRIEATQSGISNLKMSLFHKVTLEQKTAEITIPTNFVQVADNPTAINVNAIGDSFTYNGEWVKTIAERLNNVNLVGMRQSYSMTGSMRGEGRGGWKLATYAKPHDDLTPNHMQPFSPFMHVSGYTYYGPIEFWKAIVTDTSQYTYGTNGFDDYKTWFDSDGYKINPSVNDLMYNGTTNKYVVWNGLEWAETAITDADFNWDYAKYIATWNIAAPVVVLILLGTNDFLGGYSGFEVWKSQMDGLINSIKAYNASIKVGICTAFVTTGAANNSDRINRFISTRNEWEARKLVIANFDTSAYRNNGIYVVDTGVVIDPDFGFDMQAQKPFADYAGDEAELYAKNGVHCGAGGYKQLGTCAAAFVEYARTL